MEMIAKSLWIDFSSTATYGLNTEVGSLHICRYKTYISVEKL